MECTPAKEGDFGCNLEARVAGSWEELILARDNILDVESQRRPCPSMMVLGSETTETLRCVEKAGKEKHKKLRNKKTSKPPVLPSAPSLDATDQKLMKEIAECTMLRRARMERVKALKKDKNAKAVSASVSSGNAIVMVFTGLFIFIILFQGCSPSMKPSVNSFEGSPESAGFVDKDLISVHYGPIPLAG